MILTSFCVFVLVEAQKAMLKCLVYTEELTARV